VQDAGVPELDVVLLLCLAAGFAGWIDAVSGGGGLVQIPALLILLPGASPAQILATNKVSSICGTSVAATTYYRRVRPDLRTALPMAGIAMVGAALGALCASFISVDVFRPLVLILVVLVGGYVLLHPQVGEVQSLRWTGRRHHVAAAAGGLGLGFYDGIFGAGTGTFLLFLLVGLLGYSFLQGSATARIVNLATNIGALAVFAAQGAPMWRVGLVMGACNVAGGWLGAHTAIRRGSRFVRAVFLVVVAALAVRLSYDIVHG
jgi:uncharacterized membrane protein YfcA